MAQITIETYIDRLGAQTTALDKLKNDADHLLESGQVSKEKHAELVDVLNDVAIGVDDLHARLAKYAKRKAKAA